MRLRQVMPTSGKGGALSRDRIFRAITITTAVLLLVAFLHAVSAGRLASLFDATSPTTSLTKTADGIIAGDTHATGSKLPLNDSRIQQMTEGNRHMVYFHKADILFTTMAKAGSSTLWHWLYRGTTGLPRFDNTKCGTHVHEKRSKCWEGHASFLFVLPIDVQRKVLTSDHTLRVAIQRDPYERIVSAFKSKFTCEAEKFSTDVHEREFMVRGLRKAARYPGTTSCMNVTEFAQLLDRCRQNVGKKGFPKSLSELDDHIRPQDFFFDEIEYNLVLDVKHLSDLNVLQPIIQRLQFQDLVKDGIPLRHASGEASLDIPERAAGLLYAYALESKPGRLKFVDGFEPSDDASLGTLDGTAAS